MALVLVALSVAVAPDLITLPPPTEAVVVDRATLVSEGKPDSDVALPHVIFMGAGNPMVVRYRFDVAADRLPDTGLALYVPLVNRRLAVEVDGATIYDSVDHVVWTGPALGNPVLVRLPPPPPAGRPYRLTLVVEVGPFAAPTYVSQLYLGSVGKAQFASRPGRFDHPLRLAELFHFRRRHWRQHGLCSRRVPILPASRIFAGSVDRGQRVAFALASPSFCATV